MNDCIDLGLIDIKSIGTHFTWTNNDTWSKIDRLMCNQEWFTQGLHAIARFFPSVLYQIILHVLCPSLLCLRNVKEILCFSTCGMNMNSLLA